MQTKSITKCGIFLSLSLILSYVETIIPFNFGIPYAKLGLANIVTLICLYKISKAETFTIQLLRVIIMSIINGNIFSLQFSFFGFIFSFCMMLILIKFSKLDIIFISIFSAIVHNLSQVIVAIFVLGSINIISILPLSLVTGIITGLIIGVLSKIILKRI